MNPFVAACLFALGYVVGHFPSRRRDPLRRRAAQLAEAALEKLLEDALAGVLPPGPNEPPPTLPLSSARGGAFAPRSPR